MAGDDFLDALFDAERRSREIGEPPPPIVVLLDISMPRMNGFEVLQAIKERRDRDKENPGCILVLMFSSSSHAEDKAEAMSYDFVKEYIVKPLTKQNVHDVVDRYCS